MYFVYLLECADGSIYTGITTNVERRFNEHAQGKGGHYTASHGARKILHVEKRRDRGSALRREAALKKLTRSEKRALAGL